MPHLCYRTFVAATLFAFGSLSAVSAHDLVLKPLAGSGSGVPLQVMLTEVFALGDVVLPIENVKLRTISGGQTTDIALTADPAAKALTGTAAGTGSMLAIAKMSRVRPAREEAGKPPEPATLSESTSKALLNLGPGDANFGAASGDRLEIVPLANPADAKVGSELPVKILFDGKPLSARILATYDGFSTRDATYAYASGSEKDGIAYVKITAPGLWLVKVSHTATEAAPTHGRYVANANLVFEVK